MLFLSVGTDNVMSVSWQVFSFLSLVFLLLLLFSLSLLLYIFTIIIIIIIIKQSLLCFFFLSVHLVMEGICLLLSMVMSSSFILLQPLKTWEISKDIMER